MSSAPQHRYRGSPIEYCPHCARCGRGSTIPFIPVLFDETGQQIIWLCKNWNVCSFPQIDGPEVVAAQIVPRHTVDPALIGYIRVEESNNNNNNNSNGYQNQNQSLDSLHEILDLDLQQPAAAAFASTATPLVPVVPVPSIPNPNPTQIPSVPSPVVSVNTFSTSSTASSTSASIMTHQPASGKRPLVLNKQSTNNRSTSASFPAYYASQNEPSSETPPGAAATRRSGGLTDDVMSLFAKKLAQVRRGK